MEAPGITSEYFQSSMRDFSSLETLPRSWAKFSKVQPSLRDSFSDLSPQLLRRRLHGKRLLVNTGLNFRDRAIIDRHFFRLSLEHKAMAHP